MIEQKPLFAKLFILLLLLLCCTGCGKETDIPAWRPNILFISLDTLRSDHLHCYGYPLEISPVMDRLAAQGALFTNVVAQSPWTLPSHISLFTSLYPSTVAGISGRFRIVPAMKTLAACLREAGYKTGGFTGGGNIAAHFGFHHGFDLYDDQGGGILNIRKRAMAWAEEHRQDNFFLLVHCYDIHHPYVTGTPYDERFSEGYTGDLVPDKPTLVSINRGDTEMSEADRKFIISRYDAGIYYTDEQVGYLLNDLMKLDTGRDLLILVTSDHGEELGERGMMGWHGHTLYQEMTSIPLILCYPDSIPENTVIRTRIRGVDLMPTLLDYARVTPPENIAGKSLRSLLEGHGEEDRDAYAEKYVNNNFDLRHGLQDRKFSTDQFSLIRDQWKYILFVNGDDELYNLTADPDETRNLIEEEKKIAEDLRKALGEVMTRYGAGRENVLMPDGSRLDEQTRQQLKELGYIE